MAVYNTLSDFDDCVHRSFWAETVFQRGQSIPLRRKRDRSREAICRKNGDFRIDKCSIETFYFLKYRAKGQRHYGRYQGSGEDDMQFHEYGDKDKKTIMVMHGMICDWRKFREIFTY